MTGFETILLILTAPLWIAVSISVLGTVLMVLILPWVILWDVVFKTELMKDFIETWE